LKKAIAVVLSALLLGLVPATQAEAQSFKSCSALHKVYKHGIAASKNSANKGAGPIHAPKVSAAIYKLNSKLDVDRDNIACEVRKPASKPTPSSKPTQGPVSPTPMPTEMSYEAPTIASEAVDLCRMQEVSSVRAQLPAGFPQANSPTTRSGVVKWALVPIEFQDLPGEKAFRARVDDQMSLLSEWFWNVSGGRLKVEWVVLDKWATLPGKSTDYLIPNSVNVNDAANGPKLFRDAMAAADPMFDFTNIQTVNFLLPNGQSVIGESSQGFPWDSVVTSYSTNEGKIASYSIAGKFFDLPGKTYWSYWAHEFGHSIGLPHVGGGGGAGLPPFNPWDLMGGQDGPARELSGWLRFVADWLSDNQVYCRDLSSISNLGVTLVPLSGIEAGVKLVAIPVSKTKILLVESRRQTKFSCSTIPTQDGVLVYEFDATLGHFQNFLMPVTPTGRKNLDSSCKFAPQPPDSILREGDKVTVQGLTIEVVKSGKFDKVLITKG